jgi:hypothetical protein
MEMKVVGADDDDVRGEGRRGGWVRGEYKEFSYQE